ncbi:MAG: hydroxyacid dehydrogenase [Gammaproteobacteria bacterium]|nr:hydroxyacid dehydrogenase [Gammaproteobacteria bacterium]
MKALLHYRASRGFRQRLAEIIPDWLSISVVDEDDDAGLERELRDTDVLLHVLKPVTDAMIRSAPNLRLIQKIGVGVNTIDLAAARNHGIAVANMPGTNSQAVAELTLTLMLAVLRRLTVLDRQTRLGKGWSIADETIDTMGEICGRTVGLIGYGEIARRLTPVLQAMGAKVLYFSRTPKPEATAEYTALIELLRHSDIVSLHVPQTKETENLINEHTIQCMRKGAVLINTARGGLVDESALIAALKSGHLSGAGLDTFAVEPTPENNPLLALDNVVLTPHLAWLTPETLARSLQVAIENCDRLRQGLDLINQVEI